MKKNLLLIVVMSLFAITASAKKETTSVIFSVPLHCENCVQKVESNIAFEKGVKGIECNIANQTVKVTYVSEKTNVENLKKGFAKIGYADVKEKTACCSAEKTATCCDKKDTSKACCKDKQKEECNKSCADKHDHETEAKKPCCSEGH